MLYTKIISIILGVALFPIAALADPVITPTIAFLTAHAGTIAAVGSAASTAIGGLSAYNANVEAGNEARHNAAVANANAMLAEADATEQLELANRKKKQKLGNIRAQFAESGIVSTAGSSLLVLEDQAFQEDFNMSKIAQRGRFEVNDFNDQSRVLNNKANNAFTNAKVGAAGSILNVAGQVAGSLPAKSVLGKSKGSS